MIKDFIPTPFTGPNPLPSYATADTTEYTLLGTVQGGYTITLAKLTIGDSVSAGNPLTHALFESFTDHGARMAVARTRVSGFDREFTAVKNAMFAAGVEFNSAPPCSTEELLTAFGDWFMAHNPEITGCSVVSQTCH